MSKVEKCPKCGATAPVVQGGICGGCSGRTKMNTEHKPIICVDFDGVIHSYENGWQDGEIYGTATPGFFPWLKRALDHFEIVVYSSRSKTLRGRAEMENAITTWACDAKVSGELSPEDDPGYFTNAMEFSDVKPPAFLTIDDRAICFQGSWSDLDPAELLEFRTWTEIDRSGNGEFVDDYNRMIATIANFCDRYDVRKPDLIFHPRMLDKIQANSYLPLSMLGTLIFMGIRVRFGTFEQTETFRQYP